MDSIATNDDLAISGTTFDGENKDESPPDIPKAGESTQTNENTEYSDVQNEDIAVGVGLDINLGENIEVVTDATLDELEAERPKRKAKPSMKSIDNRIQSDEAKLVKLWAKVQKVISELQDAPNSVDQICWTISQVRSNFNVYHEAWLSVADFLTNIGTPECLQVRERMEGAMSNRKQFVLENISQGNDRKNEILLETRSLRSGSGSHAPSMSSTALRAQARAEAAAAMKKAEMQKKRSTLEYQSALAIQQEELALARRKLDEQARLEALYLEEAAAVALAKANAFDDELGLREAGDLPHLHLPEENPIQRVQNFIENQCIDLPASNVQAYPIGTSNQHVTLQPHDAPDSQPLNPAANTFSPNNHPTSTSNSDQSIMKSYIEFMARRELIANKIENFDNNPENFHTWKLSFKNMTRNIGITPSEELSLIIQYTTNDSKKLVQKLRNAYIANPKKGVAEVWIRLGERYGSNVVLTKAHLDKLANIPKIGFKDNKRLQEFGDLLLELQCAKEDGHLQGLRILDEPIFLKPVLTKLPTDIQTRWQRHAFSFNRKHGVDFPPFAEFSKFIQDISLERNDPNLAIERPEGDNPPQRERGRYLKRSFKTEIEDPVLEGQRNVPEQTLCIIHQKPHPLSKCRSFRTKPIEERKNLLRQHHVCFRCLASTSHIAKDCKLFVKCSECASDRHLAALHVERPPKPEDPRKVQGGERGNGQQANSQQERSDGTAQQHGGEPSRVTTTCTEVCGDKPGGRSCSKICLANIYVNDHPGKKVKAYVLIDDQSNCSLAKPQLFNLLNLDGERFPYTLKTCAGITQKEGRHAKGLVIESLDGHKQHLLPTITECDAIPDNRDEIPTPDIARAHPHLQQIANQIPGVQRGIDILLLIGRDAPPLHKVRESRNGRGNSPWAQRLDLGWVILGNTCLDGAHKPSDPSTLMTHIHHNGRPSIFEPCSNVLHVEPAASVTNYARKESFSQGKFEDGLAQNVFEQTKHDNRPGLSVEDRKFINIMDTGMEMNESGSWVAPLPFRNEVTQLPNSREEAYKRLKSTRKTLDRKPEMKEHYFAFMQKTLDNGHAEPVPPNELVTSKPCWYLPHFGVYHPRKLDKIRVVFDSAAEIDGISLNKLLLSGPDFTNSLLGVLLRFRQNPTAFMADIEQMFHSFIVKEEHRDYLRFLWYEANDPDGEVIEYRMKVHLFGNTSSPAVATFGLRKTAQIGEEQFGSDAREFVERNFYVDDGLKSLPGSEQSIDLLQRTQAMLARANLRLHKIASNDAKVTRAFPSEDRASELCDLDLSKDVKPVQRSLGVYWDLETDTFTFRVSHENKPFTRRGVLSVINSLFDPLGIASPVVIKGKMILRSMSIHLKNRQLGEWDEPLPEEHHPAWNEWCQSLSSLQNLKIPRCYTTSPLAEANRTELHVFGDASVHGIAAVCYLKSIHPDGKSSVSFVFGKAKLAPSHATTIPRLELCAAVLAVEITELVMEEQAVKPDSITYYSDSKVVLGYITNETRRFYVYVSNRVERIRKSSSPEEWRYVPTHLNPADCATRSVNANDLDGSMWLIGPKFLPHEDQYHGANEDLAPESSTDDPEVRPEIRTHATRLQSVTSLETNRFTRFSQWSSLLKGMSYLILAARSHHHTNGSNEATIPTLDGTTDGQAVDSGVERRKRAEMVIIHSVQREVYAEEIKLIENVKKLPKGSALAKLSPVIDANGLLRVGGRLERAELTMEERHPVILPGSHHVTTLIVEHYHNEVKHQGRHFTHGLVRAKGYWVIGGKRLVNRVIHQCLKCRKLRGQQVHQKMADLPVQRLTPAPPFTYVGLDVFGPWQIVTRRTRGGVAYNKRWAVIFTCLAVRAIHIELIESMDTSSFINALRRFLALRGPVAQLRSDCGTNFVGARNELKAATNEMDKKHIEAFLVREGCEWIFNPPHASHTGGVWERMIGIARRILDAMLSELASKQLTHEVLSTLMAEVTAIVNNRPLIPVSNDPEAPEILTPSTLLTQKSSALTATPGQFTSRDLHNAQWRQVQYLANVFWARWRKEFLPLLQPRRKWQSEQPNLQEGDLVLLRSKDVARNMWPLARVTKAQESADGKVRKIELVTAKDGVRHTYTRPVNEVILLKTADELNSEH